MKEFDKPAEIPLDPDQLEFIEAYAGPSTPGIYKLWKELDSEVRGSYGHLSIPEDTKMQFIAPDTQEAIEVPYTRSWNISHEGTFLVATSKQQDIRPEQLLSYVTQIVNECVKNGSVSLCTDSISYKTWTFSTTYPIFRPVLFGTLNNGRPYTLMGFRHPIPARPVLQAFKQTFVTKKN